MGIIRSDFASQNGSKQLCTAYKEHLNHIVAIIQMDESGVKFICVEKGGAQEEVVLREKLRKGCEVARLQVLLPLIKQVLRSYAVDC